MAALVASSPALLSSKASAFSAAGLPSLRPRSVVRAASPAALTPVAKWSAKEEGETRPFGSTHAAALLAAAALLLGPMTITTPPAEAAKSSGRVGGSAGFARTRSAPSPQAAPSRTTVISPTVVAPPLFGGWGMPFGGYGWGFGPTIVIGGGGGFGVLGFVFNAVIFLVIASFVVSVVTSFTRRD